MTLKAERGSFFFRHLHYTSIPATKNAPLLPGTRPTILFSHGLGGSRNAYSHIALLLASHGALVLCPEHRDGSAVTSLVRDPSSKAPSTIVPYRRISHDVCPEMYEAREAQLRIRLWELGLVYEAMVKLNEGAEVRNLNESTVGLDVLKGVMDLRPGRLVFAGHSFGSATVVQLLKSTYHADALKMDKPLFSPTDSKLREQITTETPAILLDLWATPAIGPNSEALLRLPMPCYDGPLGGKAILAVLSEAFYKWEPHLKMTARILSPTPGSESLTKESYLRDGKEVPGAHLFYVPGSAHLSQSDFGVLFPWLGRRALGVLDADRVTRLNLRAMLQFLRSNNIAVGRTSKADLAEGPDSSKDLEDDTAILEREGIEGWVWIDGVKLFKDGENGVAAVEKGEAGMEGEIEPGMDEAVVEASREKVDGQEMPFPQVDKIAVA